jgi:mannose-6-phosphate isomerase-like protein (cupin superfamily)
MLVIKFTKILMENHMKKITIFSLVAMLFVVSLTHAQQTQRAQQPPTRQDALDPRPYDPAVDPAIDMFINDWRNATPRMMYGSLIIRDILTKLEGPDPLHPIKKGAVLTNLTAISYAVLEPGNTAQGKAKNLEQQTFFCMGGSGKIAVNSKTYEVGKGTEFIITPETDFILNCTGEKLTFYVRTEPLPDGYKPNKTLDLTSRFDSDRRVGAHWDHINNGGGFISMDARTIPQPHSHDVSQEECWVMTEGETVLFFGKQILRMTPGMAYKIPQTGVTAHTNINMRDQPVQMLVMIRRAGERAPAVDYGALDSRPYNEPTEQDIDMFMGNWRDSFPRIMHGNFYFRDMLTALQGSDDLHPAKKGACLVNAEAVSYAYLEPRSSAHPVEGQLAGIQQTFIVNSGTAVITSGSKKTNLEKGTTFIITPGLDFKLTATGDEYFSCYVISEKIPQGFTPNKALVVIDNHEAAPAVRNWADIERKMITKKDGMCQYDDLTMVEMGAMTIQRPYSAGKGYEEIWIAAEGDIDMLFGKKLRKLPAGTAYRIPSTGITAHSNINATDSEARLFYLIKK